MSREGDRVGTGSGTHLEVETKFDVDPPFRLPGLDDLVAPLGAGIEAPVVHRLEATYLDTADLRLQRHRTTLRRRSGGTDAGWHLKLPAAGGSRLEVHRPLGRGPGPVPPALARLVAAQARGGALVPVARLTTTRTVLRVLDANGRPLVEVADDTVQAEVPPPGAEASLPEPEVLQPGSDGAARISTWREIEVEQVGDGVAADGSPLTGAETARLVGETLLAAGARRAAAASKIGRALAREPDPGAHRHATRNDRPTAGDEVLRYLGEHLTQLLVWDPQVRLGADDAVHRMRVATRRLRSHLSTHARVLDGAATEPVRAELRWLGGVLGAARDAEVLHARLRGSLAGLPRELRIGPVTRRIDTELRTRRREALAGVRGALDGARYLALVTSLEELLERPPLTARAGRPARRELRRSVRRALRRVEQAVRVLGEASTPAARETALHEVRKAAKRARYAGEAAAGVWPDEAGAFAAAMETVQETLGAHHDGVVARRVLRDLAVRAGAEGENAFTYGVLHGLEHSAADREVETFHGLWDEALRVTAAWPGD